MHDPQSDANVNITLPFVKTKLCANLVGNYLLRASRNQRGIKSPRGSSLPSVPYTQTMYDLLPILWDSHTWFACGDRIYRGCVEQAVQCMNKKTRNGVSAQSRK